MKNLIVLEDFEKELKITNCSLEEIGMLYYFKSHSKEFELDEFLNDVNININKFRNLINSLVDNEIINFEIDVKEETYVYWLIKNISQNKTTFKNNNNNNLLQLFILNEEQIALINEITDQREKFKRLFKVYEYNQHNYILKNEINIESEEDYKNYLKQVNPLTLLNALNVKVDISDVYCLYKAIVINNIKKEVVNFLIDYNVSTSVYNNFSITFFEKVLHNWTNNNINTLEEAMDYIKRTKEKLNTTQKGIYKEPVWEEEQLPPQDITQEQLEEIEKMIKGN